MLNKDQWFTEICKEGGSALSFMIREKLHEEQTGFQHIEIYATEKFGNLMVIDGYVMLTAWDNFIYHEMLSHPALFTHPAAEQVVIIGGGDCGTLREVLKHDAVSRVLQVEIDERVTRLAEKYFPELCTSNNDTRAEFLFGDGIQWMKDADPGSVDIVIVDSTDPIGPAEGLFTEAFYRDCFQALGGDGILVQQSEYDQPEEVGVFIEPEPAERPAHAPQHPGRRRPRLRAPRQGADGAAGDLAVRQAREDHVLVSVVGLRGGARLRPLPADEGDQVGIRRIPGQGVAAARALLDALPALGREALGVIRDREEVEPRAVAGVVAGVGGRVGTLTAEEGQRVDEGVDRVGGVDVEVAK